MCSISKTNRPHAVVLPHPPQGHLNPMLKVAKLLHHKGFYITFVNTEYNQRRLHISRGPNSLDGLQDFKFRTIPDGLPYSDPFMKQDTHALCKSITKNCLAPFIEVLRELNAAASDDVPPVSCIISDATMSFSMFAAKEFKIPYALLWTPSACSYLGYFKYRELVEQGLIPFKDMSQETNGFLENTSIEWTEGKKSICLRDIPSFIRTTDPEDVMLNFFIQEVERSQEAPAVLINTFDALEADVMKSLSCLLRSVYTIGPLHMLTNEIEDEKLNEIGSNLWIEESECIDWLNSKEPNSVVYVNFGSFTVMTKEQMLEFAWGLADSGKPFLWITRPGLVMGDTSSSLPDEFVEETKERSLVAKWCRQEQVMNHPSIGGFLTHSGWNSTIESITSGVPMICWPFYADQQTNCHYCCSEWGIGMEIDNVKRSEVEKLVRELMDGEKGKKMKENAKYWKSKAEETYKPGGSSWQNLDKLINEVLLSNMNQS